MISKTYTLYIVVIYVYVEIRAAICQHIHTHTQDGGLRATRQWGLSPAEAEAEAEGGLVVLPLRTRPAP